MVVDLEAERGLDRISNTLSFSFFFGGRLSDLAVNTITNASLKQLVQQSGRLVIKQEEGEGKVSC